MTPVIRASEVPRAAVDGPFDHLDVRWLVNAESTGAEQVSFGQTTYPGEGSGEAATHELHYHPNAEEIVVVTQGRARQVVGDETLEMGPGDVCFIPCGTPHRISAASREDLVILWVLSAPSFEAAGYVPVDDPGTE